MAGETLNMQKLATEFDVSVRTLYRDFRERLIYLDLECHQGCYRLRSGAGPQGELDVLTFAHRTGIAGLFPGLDRRLVNLLLNCEGAPCLTGDAVSAGSPATPLSFYRLVQAITTCQRVTLLADGKRCERLSPYPGLNVRFRTFAIFTIFSFCNRPVQINHRTVLITYS